MLSGNPPASRSLRGRPARYTSAVIASGCPAPSTGPERLAQGGILAPADRQTFVQPVQLQKMTLFITRQLADFPDAGTGDKAIAMDAQKDRVEFVFQASERFLDEELAGGGTHGDVLEFGFEIQDVGHRNQYDTAFFIDGKMRARLGMSRLQPLQYAVAQAVRPRQGAQETIGADRFQQVVDCIEIDRCGPVSTGSRLH